MISETIIHRCTVCGSVERIFMTCRQTVAAWLKQDTTQLPSLKETVLPYESGGYT